MPLITKIAVQNVRVHEQYVLDVVPSTTVITGANGSGKTTLIEALYIALQGSSFRGGDGDVLASGADWYRIDIGFDDHSVRTVKFDPNRQTGKKQFIINTATHYRLQPKHKYPVVLFEPNDLRLLNGSPSRRREYIDRFISQIDPLYYDAHRKYERALKQRNNLLKHPSVSMDELFVWDVSLSEYGAYISTQRRYFIDSINQKINTVYNKIADSSDTVAIRYPYAKVSKQLLLADLHAHTAKDIAVGFTSVGPHRHDILFEYNDVPALSVASRGEIRSIMLAMKFIEVDMLQEYVSHAPVILLDDVFSELDEKRQGHLVQNFKNHQVIITSATSTAKDSHMIE